MATMEQLQAVVRGMWEVPAMADYFTVFHTIYGTASSHNLKQLPAIEVEKLEDALCSGTDGGMPDWTLADLHVRLLRGILDDVSIGQHNWELTLQQYLSDAFPGTLNPMRDSIGGYRAMPVAQRVLVLFHLCHERTDARLPDMKRGEFGNQSLREYEPAALRTEPFGVDAHGNTYWYWDDIRLYREGPEPITFTASTAALAVGAPDPEAGAVDYSCTVCGLDDDGEAVLCGDGDGKGCDKAYHTACIGLDAPPPGDWFCEGCIKAHGCAACSKIDEEEALLCDGCDCSYHLTCVGVSPDSIPEGEWFCGPCTDDPDRQSKSRKLDSPFPLDPVKLRPTRTWEVICDTVEDWTDLVKALKCKVKKKLMTPQAALYVKLKDDVVPDLVERWERDEKKRKQREIWDAMPRRISGRAAKMAEIKAEKAHQQAMQELAEEDERQRRIAVAAVKAEEKRLRERAERATARECEKQEERELRAQKLALARELTLTHPWYRKCTQVLASMENYANAWIFLSPVTEDVAPGYFSVIDSPCDLSLVRERIEGGTYHLMEQYADDVFLVFDNCRTFNWNNPEFLELAGACDNYFVNKMARSFAGFSREAVIGAIESSTGELHRSKVVRPLQQEQHTGLVVVLEVDRADVDALSPPRAVPAPEGVLGSLGSGFLVHRTSGDEQPVSPTMLDGVTMNRIVAATEAVPTRTLAPEIPPTQPALQAPPPAPGVAASALAPFPGTVPTPMTMSPISPTLSDGATMQKPAPPASLSEGPVPGDSKLDRAVEVRASERASLDWPPGPEPTTANVVMAVASSAVVAD